MQLRKASSPPKADQAAPGGLRQMASSTELGVFEASSSPLLGFDKLRVRFSGAIQQPVR